MPVDLDPSRFTLLDIEHRDDGVSTVVLNRPEKRNALNVATIDELVDFFAAAPRAGVKRTSCTCVCGGTRRSTRWSTAASR